MHRTSLSLILLFALIASISAVQAESNLAAQGTIPFRIEPAQTTFNNVEGTVMAPAMLYNDGNCSLSCRFSDQVLADNLKPGWNLKVELLIMLPGSCRGQSNCPYGVRVDCTELQGPSCTGNKYVREIPFMFIYNKSVETTQTQNQPIQNQQIQNQPNLPFRVELSQTRFDNIINSVSIPTTIYNEGGCSIKCTRGDWRIDNLKPGDKVNFVVNVLVPSSCAASGSCTNEVAFECSQLAGGNCANPQSSMLNIVPVTFTNSKPEEGASQIQSSNKAEVDSANGTNTFHVDWIRIDVASKLNDVVEGDKEMMKATLFNQGYCTIKCVYTWDNLGEELITEGLNPGAKVGFNIIFFVPEKCREPCNINAHIKCYEKVSQQDPAGQCQDMRIHETDVSFDLTGIRGAGDLLLGYILLGLIVVIVIAAIYFITKHFKSKRPVETAETEGKRKLSAIMFTDVKGYSKQMGMDEEATLKKVWRYEKAMKEIIKEHEGRVVKTIGDAIMGDFDSAVHAVRAAIEIQNLLKKEDIQIRIGIHLGDVIHKAGDVFGDGVNIASRIESICEPGQIYISEDVYNQVRGKINVEFESLGSRPLKNIDRPPKVFRIK
jgi:class 3 adenylate cyclase